MVTQSLIMDHHYKYSNNEKLEILRELPKWDTQTQGEQMLLGQWL